jgi:hypothetical protein
MEQVLVKARDKVVQKPDGRWRKARPDESEDRYDGLAYGEVVAWSQPTDNPIVQIKVPSAASAPLP